MDLETLLVSLYALVDDWLKAEQTPPPPKPGRPARLSDAEVLTLAILARWPRWRSERDFWRFADAHLRTHFPDLLSQSQLNRRFRALEQELQALQRDLAETVADGSAVYRVHGTTLIPAIVRVRACRKGLFAGQASFGRCVSKTEWIYGFKVALAVDPGGVITAFGLAPANCDEGPIGDFLLSSDGHDSYLPRGQRLLLPGVGAALVGDLRDSGGRQPAEERPSGLARRSLPLGGRKRQLKRQLIEGVISQLKDQFGLERHRAKTLSGLLTRLAAKIAAYTCGLCLNALLGRPLRHLADLLI